MGAPPLHPRHPYTQEHNNHIIITFDLSIFCFVTCFEIHIREPLRRGILVFFVLDLLASQKASF